jgi:hypothetical protein
MKLSLSDGTLAVGINQVDPMIESGDIFQFVPLLPIFFPKNRGKVCLFILEPINGYNLETTIVCEYFSGGKVRFKQVGGSGK